ncbi:MAG: YdcF family protein, partial [Chloroflexota bacterium]
MFVYLSKLLPTFIYPLGLAVILIVLALGTKSKPRFQGASLVLAFFVLWVGGNAWVSTSLTRSLEWQYLPPDDLPEAEVLVVLGGGMDSSQYPRSTVEVNSAGDRVIYAAW